MLPMRYNRNGIAVMPGHENCPTGLGYTPSERSPPAMPEPANPETAKTVRTNYADQYVAVAKEWSGTPTAALALLQASELFAKLGNTDRALEVATEASAQVPADSPIRAVIATQGHRRRSQGKSRFNRSAFER